MEIPDMKMICDFEAGITCLQNQNLISRFFSLSGVAKGPQVYSFWKWGAVILLLFATLRSIIRIIKLVFIHLYSLIKPSPHPFNGVEDFDFSDDDDCSSISSEEEEEENEQSTSSSVDRDFCVKGSCFCTKSQRQNGNLRLRRRRSNIGEMFPWSEFTSGKNVVKLWDSLGLGLNFLEDEVINSKGVVSIWDFNNDERSRNSFNRSWNIPALSMASPAVVLTAEGNGKRDGVVLGAFDTRMSRGIPAVYAEWGSTTAAAPIAPVGVTAGGVEKLYVKDGVSGTLTVGDMRKLKKPIENVKESDVETWWDADAVMVEDEFELVDESI